MHSALFLALALVACGPRATTTGPVTAERIANPQALAKLAQGAAAAREPAGQKRAAELFREALTIDASLWEARYDLGVVLAASGELDAAAKELSKALEGAPNEESIVIALAEVERRRGRTKEGAEQLGQFLKAHPRAASVRESYVGALREAKQPDKALAEARELLGMHPGEPGALAELALCYLAKGDAETAQLVAKQAVDASSKTGTKDDKVEGASKSESAAVKQARSAKRAEKAYLAQAMVAYQRGNDAEAFAAFQKAAELDPSDPTPKMNMGAIYLRAGQFPKADEQFRAVLMTSRDDIDALVGLAVALRGQGSQENPGKWGEAKATLEKVLTLDKDNLAAQYNLAVLYMNFLKKPDDAKTAYARFLKLAPSSHPQVAAAKKAIEQIDAFKGAQ